MRARHHGPSWRTCNRPPELACRLHRLTQRRHTWEVTVGTSVLITDADTRAAVAAARSLVRAGHRVWVAAGDRYSLAGACRGAAPCRVGADPLRQPEAFTAQLARLIRERGIEVLLPITDASVDAILHRRDVVPDVRLPFPTTARYRLGSDKLRVLELGQECGFAVPETVVLSAKSECDALPDPKFFPAVVKPHRSVIGGPCSRSTVGVTLVEDRRECRAAIAALPAAAFPVLLQRRVHGPGEGLFLLRWNGRIIAAFAHRRLREKPPAGGVSTYCESIPFDAPWLDAGARLLAALAWDGVAMIECKRDPGTGRHVLMELNGRLWGSLQLAIDAGVDFPRLLVECARGMEVAPVLSYRVGLRSRWLWGDVDRLYLRLTRSPRTLHVDRDAGSRWRELITFLAHRPGRDHCAVFRWSDPGPFLVETLKRLQVLR